MSCPNKNTQEYKKLREADYSEGEIYAIFQKNKQDLPDLTNINGKEAVRDYIENQLHISERLYIPVKNSFGEIEDILNEHQIRQLFNSLTYNVLDVITSSSDAKTILTFDNARIADVYSEVRNRLVNQVIDFFESMSNEDGTFKSSVNDEKRAYYTGQFKRMWEAILDTNEDLSFKDDSENWSKIINAHKKELQNNNIRLVYDENFVNEGREEDERGKDTAYDQNSFEIDSKVLDANAIKRLMLSIPAVNKHGEMLRNELGVYYSGEPITNFLKNNLANLPADYNVLYNRLKDLSNTKPVINTLIRILGEPNTGNDYNEILRTMFVQSFCKQKQNFIVVTTNNEGGIIVLNQNSNKEQDLIRQRFRSNLLGRLRKMGESFINPRTTDGLINLIRQKLIRKQYRDALNLLGIEFSNSNTYKNPDLPEIVTSIIEHGDVSKEDLYSNKSSVASKITKLIELESQNIQGEVELQLNNANGKQVYSVGLHHHLSSLASELNTYKDELKERFPYLFTSFSNDSIILNEIKKGNAIQFNIADGYNQKGGNGKTTSDLSPSDRYSQLIALTLSGNYSFFRAADRSVESTWSFKDNKILANSEREAINYFIGQLKNEIKSAREINNLAKGEIIPAYIAEMDKGSRFTDLVRGGQLIYLDGIIKSIDNTVLKDILTSEKDIDNWIEDYMPLIEKDIKSHLEKRYLEEKDEWITLKLTDGENRNIGLSKELVKDFGIDGMIKRFVWNSELSYIEQSRVITGNPAIFKNLTDFFKRTSAFNGTKKVSRIDDAFNNYLNNNFPRKDGKTSRNIIKTIIYEDPKITRQDVVDYVEKVLRDSYKNDGLSKEAIDKKVNDAISFYKDVSIADAMAFVTLDEWRDIMLKAGDFKVDYLSKEGKDEWKRLQNGSNSNIIVQPIKTQHVGQIQDVTNMLFPGLYKHVLVPLIPSAIKGTKLEPFLEHMVNNQIGISQFRSGNKFGTLVDNNGKTNTFFNNDGSINTKKLITQSIHYKNIGIQLDISDVIKNRITASTQARKQMWTNSMENGRFVNAQAEKRFKDYIKYQDDKIDHLFNTLLKKFELNDNLEITNRDALVKELIQQANIRKNASVNDIFSIQQLIDRDVFIDELSQGEGIENILMSLVNNGVIKEKRIGGAKIQVSSVGLTSFNKESIQYGKEGLLKFYHEKDGRIQPMEIMMTLPAEWENFVKKNYNDLDGFNKAISDGKIDERLLRLVGFRIPNTGLNSTDVAKIVKFLPRSAGDQIILPYELISKAGSDYDVDKFNIYTPIYNKSRLKDGELIYNEEHLDNRRLEIEMEQILAPENTRQLLTPIGDSMLKSIVSDLRNQIAKSLLKKEDKKTYTDLLSTLTNMKMFKEFLTGKKWIGIIAKHLTSHMLSQSNNIYVMDNNAKLFFRHNKIKIDGEIRPSLSHIRDIKGNYISETMSEFLTACVDIAKDPYLFDLTSGVKVFNTALYMLRLGADPEFTFKFLNQPIIKEFIKQDNINSSGIVKSNGLNVKRNTLINIIFSKFNAGIEQKNSLNHSIKKLKWDLSDDERTNTNTIINTLSSIYSNQWSNEDLDKMLSDSTSSNFGKNQGMILDQFLVYLDQADKLGNFVNAYNQDTTGLGKNIHQTSSFIQDRQDVRDEGFIGNLDKLDNSSIITPFNKVVDKSYKMFAHEFVTQSPLFKENLDEMIDTFQQLQSGENKIKVARAIKNDFITYLIQTTPNSVFKVDDCESLFKENSIPLIIQKIQNGELYPSLRNNEFINQLIPILDNGNIDSLKLFNRKLTPIDKNRLIRSFEDVFTENRELGRNLIKFVLNQSGVGTTPVTYLDLVPAREVFLMLKPIFSYIKGRDIQIESFNNFLNSFCLNEKNSKWLPKYTETYSDEFDPITGDEIKIPKVYNINQIEAQFPYHVAWRENKPVFLEQKRLSKDLVTYDFTKRGNSLGKSIYKVEYRPEIDSLIEQSSIETPYEMEDKNIDLTGGSYVDENDDYIFETDDLNNPSKETEQVKEISKTDLKTLNNQAKEFAIRLIKEQGFDFKDSYIQNVFGNLKTVEDLDNALRSVTQNILNDYEYATKKGEEYLDKTERLNYRYFGKSTDNTYEVNFEVKADEQGKYVNIGEIFFLKEARGKGLGKELVRLIEEFAKNEDINRLKLYTSTNSEQERFWKREGFVSYKIDDFTKSGGDSYNYMEKILFEKPKETPKSKLDNYLSKNKYYYYPELRGIEDENEFDDIVENKKPTLITSENIKDALDLNKEIGENILVKSGSKYLIENDEELRDVYEKTLSNEQVRKEQQEFEPSLKENPVNIDAKFPKDQTKANYADGIIGYGTHSTGKYAEKFGGTRTSFKQDEVIMISVNGNNRPNQKENVEKTKQAIDKAIQQGVKAFIADNKTVANSSHNSGGEGEISKYLESKGLTYKEFKGVGLYVVNNTKEQLQQKLNESKNYSSNENAGSSRQLSLFDKLNNLEEYNREKIEEKKNECKNG